MQKLVAILSISFLSFIFCNATFAQQDSSAAAIKKVPAKTTVAKKEPAPPFSPRTATIRSAIIPGWGQIYNHQYWKVPLVYGALGTTAGIFFYNLKYYLLLKKAYIYSVDTIPVDNRALIDPQFKNLSPQAIMSYRNEFRQDIDYSALFFIIFWGLNVVDASVDAHLKTFDISPDLSLEIRPGPSPMANTSGLSLIFHIEKKDTEPLIAWR